MHALLVVVCLLSADLSPRQEKYLESIKPNVVRIGEEDVRIPIDAADGEVLRVEVATTVDVTTPSRRNALKQGAHTESLSYHVVRAEGDIWYLDDAQKKKLDEEATWSARFPITVAEGRLFYRSLFVSVALALAMACAFQISYFHCALVGGIYVFYWNGCSWLFIASSLGVFIPVCILGVIGIRFIQRRYKRYRELRIRPEAAM